MASPAQAELTELIAELRRFEEMGGGVSDLKAVIAGTRSALLAFEGDIIKMLKEEELEVTWTSNLGDVFNQALKQCNTVTLLLDIGVTDTKFIASHLISSGSFDVIEVILIALARPS
jgi:hypothetical protein